MVRRFRVIFASHVDREGVTDIARRDSLVSDLCRPAFAAVFLVALDLGITIGWLV